jgi:hypothetical protein
MPAISEYLDVAAEKKVTTLWLVQFAMLSSGPSQG